MLDCYNKDVVPKAIIFFCFYRSIFGQCGLKKLTSDLEFKAHHSHHQNYYNPSIFLYFTSHGGYEIEVSVAKPNHTQYIFETCIMRNKHSKKTGLSSKIKKESGFSHVLFNKKSIIHACSEF